MSSHPKSNINKRTDATTTRITDDLTNRYVITPLTWWDDGKCTLEDIEAPAVIGCVIKDSVKKKQCHLRECEILYEPVGDYEESVCNVKVHVVHEMLLPPDYELGPDS